MIILLTDKYRLRGTGFQWVLEAKGKNRDGNEAWNSDAHYNGIGSALSGWFEKELRTANRTVTLQELMVMLYDLLDGPQKPWDEVVAWVGRLGASEVSTGQLGGPDDQPQVRIARLDESGDNNSWLSCMGSRNEPHESKTFWQQDCCPVCGATLPGQELTVNSQQPETDLGMTDAEKELWG